MNKQPPINSLYPFLILLIIITVGVVIAHAFGINVDGPPEYLK